MNSLDLDVKMSGLESEWRHAYERSIVARVKYQKLAATGCKDFGLLDDAREQLEKAEANKARIMLMIERLEDLMLGRDA